MWFGIVIPQHVAYNVRMEPGVQTCEDTLDTATGSCRDTAWLDVTPLKGVLFGSGEHELTVSVDVEPLSGM